ncbi:MAG TPA: hypothetical protein VF174_04725 [Micromonosporaceae bacterium]
MVLREPVPGLRRIHHNANSPKRVELIVPAGDVLEVSEQVAAQLQAADPHFQAVEEPAEPPAKPAKKTTSRKA